MKKLVTLVFTGFLALAVLNVSAFDKNSKKVKSSKKAKVKSAVQKASLATDNKSKKSKVITIADLKKLRKDATK